jgi:TolB-like protein/Flp pilus assembly protein TadD
LIASADEGPLVRFGAFELNLGTGELRRAGALIRLAPQPFKVLALLARRAGQVVSREELREQLWERDTFVDFEQGLNHCIKQIRTALGDDADNPHYVETLSRRGHRFIAHIEPTGRPTASPEKPTISKVLLAVVPFDNLSPDPDQKYFSDGMTEEMIAHLGMLSPQNLGVIARTSVMKYQSSGKGITEIGKELGVDYILEGSVRRAGERVLISAQLIQVSDQTHLWAKSYERGLSDVFAIQIEVASHIADSLAMQLLARPTRPSFSTNLEALDLYLKGRYFWNRRTLEALTKAIGYFEGAIHEDPGYAHAYAGLADCYAMLGWNTMLPPADSQPKSKAAALRAIEIDDKLADAHCSRAVASMLYDWDWAHAEAEFKRSIELNPSYGVTRPWYAFELTALGRHAEAITEVQRAIRLDPFSLAINASAGMVLSLAGRHDQAVEQCLQTIEMDPKGFYQAYFVLGTAYAGKGMLAEAAGALESAVALSNRNPHMLATLGYIFARAGRTQEAYKVLDELNDRSARSYVPPYNLALVHIGLGEKEEAFAWLEKAYQDRSTWMIFLNVHPVFESLRPDPRFIALVDRMGLHFRQEQP